MTANEYDRCYLNADDGTGLVFRLRTLPLHYLVTLNLTSVLELVSDLKMPNDLNGLYDLRFLSVKDFLRERGVPDQKLHRKYQGYTVQTFGSVPRYERGMKLPLPTPDPSQYKSEPKYFLDLRPTQIWRIRVYPYPPEEIKSSVHNPFGTFPPGTVYVEERWHPETGVSRLIGGLENAPKSSGVRLDELYVDALRILEGGVKRGRPMGSTEIKRIQFVPCLLEAYQTVKKKTGRNPSPKEVAKEMDISRGTFYNYRRRSGISWPPE
jgi:hypothetical protein